jgi:beta-N-acetylhexosaminidase
MILGAIPAEAAEKTLVAYTRAGIRAFLFPGSFLAEPERLSALAETARRLSAEAGLGLPLIALGGGDVASCEAPDCPDLPSPLCLGAGGERSAARRAGRFFAHSLSRLGVGLVFAPRLDLATDPKARGGVLHLFGEEPHQVAALGESYARGLGQGGVAACAGAFPGAGLLVSEGHSGQPLLSLPEERLLAVEMRPFAHASRARIPAILVGRFLVPALEPERIPAARSARIIEGRLREQLGFRGLVVGAPLDEDSEGPARAALLGALAGCDLTVALAPEAALEAAEGLKRYASSGELPAPRAVLASRRLSRLIERRIAAPAAEDRPAGRGAEMEAERRAAFSRRALERGATALRGAGSFYPSGASLSVFLFEPRDSSADAAQAEPFYAALSGELPGARIFRLPADPEPSDADALLASIEAQGGAGQSPAALVLSYDAHLRPAQESVIHLLGERFPSLSVIALKDPYDAAFFPRAAALGAVYGYSAESARAAARLASGRLEARGSCPVSVLGLEL